MLKKRGKIIAFVTIIALVIGYYTLTDLSEDQTVSAVEPRKYTIDELVKDYMRAIYNEDAELVYSLVSTDLYGRGMDTASGYMSLEIAEKEGLPFADPTVKAIKEEEIKKYLEYQHSEIERIWGTGAFDNYSYTKEEMLPLADGSIEIYVVKDSGIEISYEEYSRLNQAYCERIAKENGLTVDQLKTKEHLDVFIDNLANEPAGIALKNDLKRYLIRLSFFGSDIAEDGSEFFTFHVVGNEDSWYIFSGLYWDDPLVDEGPDV